MIKAVKVYDPDKGANFATAAVWWIRSEIQHSMAYNEHIIRLPISKQQMLIKLQRFRRSFVNEYGFEPRIDEISAFLEVSRPVAERLLKVEAQDQIGSLNSPIKDADGEYEVMDTVPDEHNHYEDLEESVKELTGFAREESAAEKLEYAEKFLDPFPATVNDPACARHILNSCHAELLEKPMRWSEDFGTFLQHKRGAFFGIGSGEECPGLHTEKYEYPDELLRFTALAFLGIVTSDEVR